MPIPIKNLDKNNSIKLFDKPAVMAKTTKNIRSSPKIFFLPILSDNNPSTGAPISIPTKDEISTNIYSIFVKSNCAGITSMAIVIIDRS